MSLNIILYGIRGATLIMADTIKKEHNIIGISDDIARVEEYGPYSFIPKEELKNTVFDYIIVCISQREKYELAKKELTGELQIPEEKILSFEALFFEQRVDQIMLRARYEKKSFDGLIIGSTHAQCGIHPGLLDGSWANIAVASEDLFAHKKVFQKCVEEYADCIRNLKEVIIDLHDYSLFHFDASQSRYYVDSLTYGGYSEELHNLAKNPYCNAKELERFIEKSEVAGGYSSSYARSMREVRKVIFEEEKAMKLYAEGALPGPCWSYYLDFIHPDTLIAPIAKEPKFPVYLYCPEEKREDTVQENAQILKELVQSIRAFCPEVKLYFVLLPNYKLVEEYHEVLMEEYRELFREIICPYTKEGIFFLDFKRETSISENRAFYGKPNCLRYIGAIAFTTLLKERLQEINQ